jgi:hypothetical protein
MSDDALSQVHYELVRGLVERNACPSNAELAQELGLSSGEVEDLLRSLAAIHGVVLHPHVCEPWIIHPFSLTPTLNWIEGERGGWWAPCVWCAFGVAALVGGKVRIHTRLGGESESLTIPVENGEPDRLYDFWVHFAIPPVRAWDNVHQHCSLVLPFRSPEEIQGWCKRHCVPMGQAVPLPQVARLARRWYGSHADRDWHKWSVAEAQDIFRQTGLDSPFWDLRAISGKF